MKEVSKEVINDAVVVMATTYLTPLSPLQKITKQQHHHSSKADQKTTAHTQQ